MLAPNGHKGKGIYMTNSNNVANKESKKQLKVDINKRPAIYKLLCANYNKDETKIGLSLLDYSGILQNGHLDSPTINQFWIDIEINPEVVKLGNKPLYSDVACIVSGGGDFMKFHKLLTKEQYDSILAMF